MFEERFEDLAPCQLTSRSSSAHSNGIDRMTTVSGNLEDLKVKDLEYMKEECMKETKDLAECRLQMRYDTIMWKYHWEITSAHAAMVASKRILRVEFLLK